MAKADEITAALSSLRQIFVYNKSGKLHEKFDHTQSTGLNIIQHRLPLIFGKKAKHMSFTEFAVEQHSRYLPVNLHKVTIKSSNGYIESCLVGFRGLFPNILLISARICHKKCAIFNFEAGHTHFKDHRASEIEPKCPP